MFKIIYENDKEIKSFMVDISEYTIGMDSFDHFSIMMPAYDTNNLNNTIRVSIRFIISYIDQKLFTTVELYPGGNMRLTDIPDAKFLFNYDIKKDDYFSYIGNYVGKNIIFHDELETYRTLIDRSHVKYIANIIPMIIKDRKIDDETFKNYMEIAFRYINIKSDNMQYKVEIPDIREEKRFLLEKELIYK